jgi:taurine dioxygenase
VTKKHFTLQFEIGLQQAQAYYLLSNLSMLAFVFENVDLQTMDAASYAKIRSAVSEHGVVCIKNQRLSVDELVQLTERFGEPVKLPEALRFNNTYKAYPQVARVSNILPDGTLLQGHKAAEHWHSDGDFWQPRRNFLFNFLYSKTAPAQGGDTGFVDLRTAYESLDPAIKAEIQGLKVAVSCDEIPDFKDVSPQEREPDAYHQIKHSHIETGRVGLYIGHAKATIHGVSSSESDRIMGQLVAAIEDPVHQHMHEWTPGDLLIWDNTSVMHRSMGGYGNHPRLLYRTQAFIQPLI